jgi:chemotaxis protein MotA
MKLSTGACIGMAFAGILVGAFMEGTSPASFIDIPAILIIILGTAGATGASVGPEAMGNIVPLYKIAFKTKAPDVAERVNLLVSLAEQARREGLLALDERVNQIDDEFTRKGLQLVVDGIDPDLVRDVLDAEIDGMIARHHHGSAMFTRAGGFAPTMGIIGTVMGLVHVLQNLSAPSTLGPSISSAFVATLLGIGSANVIYLPVAGRLEGLSKAEVELRTLTLDGILAVQAGDNPRVVAEKLNSYIAPTERLSEEQQKVVEDGEQERAAEAA